MVKKISIGVGVLVLLVVAFGLFRTLSEPGHLYKHTGEFAACPSRPSCVSSRARGEPHAIEPIRFRGQLSTVPTDLVQALRTLPGLVEIERDGNYVHAVFATPMMRYRDDLEVLVGSGGTADVRSISRFGYRDFGVNRERVEMLRRAFDASRN